MTAEDAIEALIQHQDAVRAENAAAYHKADRRYLGVPNPQINDLAAAWRRSMESPEKLELAQTLWESDIHEARIAAAKLLTQSRIRDDAATWALIQSWVPEFDGWAIADHACAAGSRRIMADLTRLQVIAPWTEAEHLWTKRAALVITLPLARLNHPSAEETAARETVLEWTATLVADQRQFIQKAVAWWLRDLSKHDAVRVRGFLDMHGAAMKPFARKEAAKYLPAQTPASGADIDLREGGK
ncbi:DNA alkylation repair protein [Pseudooceanicola algae]|uniref:Uncharacterized protein n=1 Tax=Pseudooceanicola algae TaxID=1537215 RepID=A0A418SF85_9RHOB|nr:DNA alkylation repair protein [Pseudooceanicola algae]QPM89260.1 hypothetical protein PSAL_004750 [Pseudooceanicola algae]